MGDRPDDSVDPETLDAALDQVLGTWTPDQAAAWFRDVVQASGRLGEWSIDAEEFGNLDVGRMKELIRTWRETTGSTGIAEIDGAGAAGSNPGVRYNTPTVAGFTLDPEPDDSPTVEFDPEPLEYRPTDVGGVTVDPPTIPLDSGTDAALTGTPPPEIPRPPEEIPAYPEGGDWLEDAEPEESAPADSDADLAYVVGASHLDVMEPVHPVDPVEPDTTLETPPCWGEEQALSDAQRRLAELEAELDRTEDPQSETFQAVVGAIRATKEDIRYRQRQLDDCRRREGLDDRVAVSSGGGFLSTALGRTAAALTVIAVGFGIVAVTGVFGGEDDPATEAQDATPSLPADGDSGGAQGDGDAGTNGDAVEPPADANGDVPEIVSAHPCDLVSEAEIEAATFNPIARVERLEDESWSTCVWHSAPGPFTTITVRVLNVANRIGEPDDALQWARSNAANGHDRSTPTVKNLGFGFVEESHILRLDPTTIVGPDGRAMKEVEGYGTGWATTHCADIDQRLGLTIHGNAFGGSRAPHPEWYGLRPQAEDLERALVATMAMVYDGLVALQDAPNQGGAGCPINDAPPPPLPDANPQVGLTTIAVPARLIEPGQTAIAVLVKNTGNVPWTVQSFDDQTFGDVLSGLADPAVNTCAGSWGLDPGGTWQCAFFVGVLGSAPRTQTSTATITVADADGNIATSTHVNVVDLVAAADAGGGIIVTKSADQAQLPPGGGDVFFSISVTNETDRTVTIGNIIDSEFGDLLDPASPFTFNDCLTGLEFGRELAPQGTFSCSFSETVEPADGASAHENTVVVEVLVDDAVYAAGSGSATITFG